MQVPALAVGDRAALKWGEIHVTSQVSCAPLHFSQKHCCNISHRCVSHSRYTLLFHSEPWLFFCQLNVGCINPFPTFRTASSYPCAKKNLIIVKILSAHLCIEALHVVQMFQTPTVNSSHTNSFTPELKHSQPDTADGTFPCVSMW